MPRAQDSPSDAHSRSGCGGCGVGRRGAGRRNGSRVRPRPTSAVWTPTSDQHAGDDRRSRGGRCRGGAGRRARRRTPRRAAAPSPSGRTPRRGTRSGRSRWTTASSATFASALQVARDQRRRRPPCRCPGRSGRDGRGGRGDADGGQDQGVGVAEPLTGADRVADERPHPGGRADHADEHQLPGGFGLGLRLDDERDEQREEAGQHAGRAVAPQRHERRAPHRRACGLAPARPAGSRRRRRRSPGRGRHLALGDLHPRRDPQAQHRTRRRRAARCRTARPASPTAPRPRRRPRRTPPRRRGRTS